MNIVRSLIGKIWQVAVSCGLVRCSNEQAYFARIANRDIISDDVFYREYYSHSNVTLDTCVRIRRVLCEQLRMCNSLPHDNVASIFEDVDIGEVCFEIAEEFNVKFSEKQIQTTNGTVDSLIRMTQKRIDLASNSDYPQSE